MGHLAVASLLILVPMTGAWAQQQSAQAPILQSQARISPEYARTAMVASQHHLASEVGRDILKAGGNAVDAAVATGFALAVVLPRAGNLAGGGFLLLYLAEEDRVLAFDYREMAPARASTDMFLNEAGEADSNLSRYTLKASGVPGTVAGLHHVWSQHGSLPWKKLLAPAIRLADRGFAVSRGMHWALQRARHLKRNPAARALFYDSDGNALAPGTRLVQSDLARTLRLIARHGQAGFYRGPVAEAIVRTMKTDGGLLTLEDLANYKVVEREPIQGNYRGNRVFAMPPPSSGGIHLVQMLNILEGYDLKSMGRGSAQSLHLLAEAMKPAFADRSVHLGDSDFFAVPAEWLTSKAYATQLRSRIEPGRARTPQEVRPGRAPAKESEDTTHFSVVDAQGNAVSNTYTLNFSYGSGIMVPGTGILLNNEMDDFSAKAGTPNAFGLLGNEANAVEPGKRPLSSMTPTLMFDAQGSLRLVTGSPGGSRIITAVLQHVVDIVDFGLNISESAAAPRMHHQWQPPMLFHESGFSPDTLSLLKSRGHDLRPTRFFGALQSIAIAPDGSLMGMSDPRRPDGKPAGY